jgi:hypothetical protein
MSDATLTRFELPSFINSVVGCPIIGIKITNVADSLWASDFDPPSTGSYLIPDSGVYYAIPTI